MSELKSIILASGSPRRRQLLDMVQWPHTVIKPDIEEAKLASESIREYIARNAREKAQHVAEQQESDAVVLAADTVVVLDDVLLEKPQSKEEARSMLERLSDHSHIVWTAFHLQYKNAKVSHQIVETEVQFRPLTSHEIDSYIDMNTCMDKSGSYGIQDDMGAGFVKGIRGSYTNVVGLPLAEVIEAYKALTL